MLKKGLTVNEFYVYREEQRLDGIKPDITVNFSLIGNIIIEIKLSDNPELNKGKAIAYSEKMEKYLSNAHFGYLLIIQSGERKLSKVKFENLQKTYHAKFGNKIEVIEKSLNI